MLPAQSALLLAAKLLTTESLRPVTRQKELHIGPQKRSHLMLSRVVQPIEARVCQVCMKFWFGFVRTIFGGASGETSESCVRACFLNRV